MITIDIPTTQNVTIQYEVASTKERFIAAMLDLIFVGIFIAILSFMGAIVGIIESELFWVFPILVFIFSSFVQEIIFKGQTFGKKATKIRVMRLDGQRPELFNYMARWAFKLVDVYMSSGAIGVTMIKSSGKGQRLGDVIGDTVLVRLNPTYQPKLDAIANIVDVQKYTPVYPNVSKLSESDILLIKETIDRSIKYKNSAHQYALILLADKVCKLLEIKDKVPSPDTFLKTVIQDFVVITR
ncbi:MAG: RDD family protein [Bacteroidetes bacterium]|nr:RDD family protein [Bacteroidota bacterium]